MPGTKCNTKNPKPAAKTIDTAIISKPEAIPPSLNAIYLVIFKLIIEHICYLVIVLITHKSSKLIINGE